MTCSFDCRERRRADPEKYPFGVNNPPRPNKEVRRAGVYSRCFWCRGSIPVNTQYERLKFSENGRLFVKKMHWPACPKEVSS